MNPSEYESWLGQAQVSEDVRALRPDYSALLILADGLRPGASDEHSEQLLQAAESNAISRLSEDATPEELPELAAWRETYRAFGAKPQRTRPSVEALVRRAESGLPRVDRITDTYNAISVMHLLPMGGEDADLYAGHARLIRATGTENFETMVNGEVAIEHPEEGEVVWADDLGVTCRRWNWRQSVRTRITGGTTSALFIIDALGEVIDQESLARAGAELEAALRQFSPDATFTSRLI